MAGAELHKRLTEPVCMGTQSEIAIEPAPDRRVHERVNATLVEWLRGARIKYGAEVRVLDLSAGGIRLETKVGLEPNARVVLELTRPDNPILVVSQVIRCRAASLGGIIEYEAACAFKRPLVLPELTMKPRHQLQHPSSSLRHAAAPSAGWQKVVARFNDGRIECAGQAVTLAELSDKVRQEIALQPETVLRLGAEELAP